MTREDVKRRVEKATFEPPTTTVTIGDCVDFARVVEGPRRFGRVGSTLSPLYTLNPEHLHPYFEV